MAMEDRWEAAKAAVEAYTGMTPAAFFTIVAVSAALYVAMSGLLARPAQASRGPVDERSFEPLPPPVQLGEVTEEELRAYDGSDPKKPLLTAIKGQIYDVTQSRIFYGPGGPYASFAGRDASRALAKMSFEPDDLSSDISGLAPLEIEALKEWEYKFKGKYVTVGTVKKSIPVSEGDTARSAMTAAVTVDRDIDANTIEGHVAKELLDQDEPNTSNHADVVERLEEAPNVVERNTSKSEDVVDLELVDEKNTSKPEQAEEKPKEAPNAVGMNNTVSHENVGQPKEILEIDEKDLSFHHSKERPKEALEF